MKVAGILATLLFVLTACGRVADLKHRAGTPPLPTETGASAPATAEALITPNTQSRPSRNVDLVRRSEPRSQSDFDLDPGPDNGRQD